MCVVCDSATINTENVTEEFCVGNSSFPESMTDGTIMFDGDAFCICDIAYETCMDSKVKHVIRMDSLGSPLFGIRFSEQEESRLSFFGLPCEAVGSQDEFESGLGFHPQKSREG